MTDPTNFDLACSAHGWDKPTDFLRAFDMTANVLGEAVTLTERQFRRWRLPKPPGPRARSWRVLHAMFGVSPQELGLPGPPPGVAVGYAPPRITQENLTVGRRDFLADSIGAAASVGLPQSGLTRAPSGRSDAVGTPHLLELREGLRSLYHLDNAYGGGDVFRLAERHLRRVRRVINTGRYPDTIGKQLHLLAGETAEHCAWLAYDGDRQAQARAYWGEALTTAAMIRDSSLEILVMSGLSLQASYEGRPREGHDLARAAQERAAAFDSPILQSVMASRRARALSVLHDATSARQQLADSMRLVDRAGRGGRPGPQWAAFHGHAELEYHQGLMWAELGHHGRAVSFLRASLEHQDRIYGRNRALYRLTLSRSLIGAGEVDEGADHAVSSLGHLDEVESGRVLRRLGEVRASLDSEDAVAAREASEALAEYVEERAAA
ncbi:hypothetical protein J8N05_45545 [Streptomyces sp. BH-SS-21]|uniref:NsdA n=1 Tax=Streptomyces liliiviolaceus TaxID=2823109 RepID=A0A940Y2K5_9ACTN|nr:hypothetical protein [Streptomyces liliiviolaceus]MBQ0855437.1 hypothetical protein [Streptomyces liliiviolaceus]